MDNSTSREFVEIASLQENGVTITNRTNECLKLFARLRVEATECGIKELEYWADDQSLP